MATPYISQFSRGEQLLNLLGTFWTNTFSNRTALRDMNLGTAQLHGHNYIKWLEAIATLSRFKIPVFSENRWDLITIRDSDRTSNKLKYGDGTVYGDPVVYGGSSGVPSNTFKLRYDLREILGCLMDKPINPTKVWLPDGVTIENGFITFDTDPFTELTNGRVIMDDLGVAVDTEIDLFVYRGGYDLQFVYKHFGYVLDIQMKSTQFYKDLLNVLWTARNDGLSVSNLFDVLDIIAGIPRANGNEVIEQILPEADQTIVITDKTTYSIPASLTLLPGIVVGAELEERQQFTSAVTILELSNSTLDIDAITPIELPRLAFGDGFIPILNNSSLSAENKVVPLEIVGMSGPNPLLEFELTGYQHDIDRFWADVRAKELETGKTFAEYFVDAYMAVPATINPLLFILKEILRENLVIIRLDASGYIKLNSTKEFIAEMYKLFAAHTTFLVFIEEVLPEEIVDTTEYTESLVEAIGGELDDTYDLTTVVDTITASLEPEPC